MKLLMRSKALALAFRLVIGAILLYASYDKLLGPQTFADAVDNYRILHRALVNLFAIALPWVEFVTGLCMLLGVAVAGAAAVAAAMFAAFIVALLSALVRGLNIDCGCFTLAGKAEMIALRSLWPRLLLLLAALQVMAASNLWERPALAFIHRRPAKTPEEGRKCR